MVLDGIGWYWMVLGDCGKPSVGLFARKKYIPQVIFGYQNFKKPKTTLKQLRKHKKLIESCKEDLLAIGSCLLDPPT